MDVLEKGGYDSVEMDHFKVLCSVTRSLNESEARVALVMLTSFCGEVCIEGKANFSLAFIQRSGN